MNVANQNNFQNTEDLGQFCFIDLSEIIANHGAKLLWGNGFILESEFTEYQECINKWKKWINFDSLFYQDFKVKSYWGYSIITIDQTKSGRLALTLAQPYAVSRVARIFETEQMAITWSRVVYDDQAIYVRTEYTNKTITRQFMNNSMVLSGIQEKISKDLELPLYEVHNLGIIPVKFMQNLPKKNFFGGVIGDFYPDLTPVKKMQSLLDHTFSNLWKELEYNRTRVFLDLTNQEINQLESAYDIKKFIGDFLLQANMRTIGATSGKAIEILQGNPQLQEYMSLLDWIIEETFNGAGYSYKTDSTAQKTEAEVLTLNSKDLSTTRVKRTLFQSDWNEIFKKMFILSGLDGDDSKWTFQIKEHTIINMAETREMLEWKYRMWLINRENILVELDGISKQEAINILQEVDISREKDLKSTEQLSENNKNVSRETEEDNKGDNNV